MLVFLESNCDDPKVIADNVALKASAGDPDYAGQYIYHVSLVYLSNDFSGERDVTGGGSS